ncbi:MAG: hypothetical protein ACMZI0_03355 [Symbiopectobacterium sp.]|uniref:hypothetical protein n=1 Tax=Symbiopectobacterium sp. TaxID=2952789 RepID=UPI0039EC6644
MFPALAERRAVRRLTAATTCVGAYLVRRCLQRPERRQAPHPAIHQEALFRYPQQFS